MIVRIKEVRGKRKKKIKLLLNLIRYCHNRQNKLKDCQLNVQNKCKVQIQNYPPICSKKCH